MAGLIDLIRNQENMRYFISLSLIVCATAFAQGPQGPRNPQRQPGPGGEFSALKNYLGLTDTQLSQIRKGHEEAARQAGEKAKAAGPQMEEKRKALEALMSKPNADPAAVGKAMLEMQAAQKQAHGPQEAVRKSFLDVLTPEQKTKFKAIQEGALLPAATQEAMRLGLVPGAPNRPGPGGMGMMGRGMMNPGSA